MTNSTPNLALTANVMLTVDPSTSRELTDTEMLAYLPGDFLVRVQSAYWKDINFTLQHMTVSQRSEYRQNMMCRACHRRCAGSCKRP